VANLKDIISEIDELGNLKNLTGAYQEISTMKMRRIRSDVLASRDFIDELTKIYQEITISYRNQILELLKTKKDTKSLSLRQQNGQTACVFLSANSGLFGAIMKQTYDQFADFIEKNNAYAIIVGDYGKELFTRQFPSRKFTFFPLEGSASPGETFKNITKELLPYQNVIMFYARFNTMASQNVTVLDVAGEKTASLVEEIKKINYHFEPSLETILQFFEQEIFANIIEQNFTDSELARHAYRIVALDTATKNIENKLKIVDLERRIATHRIMNKKQSEALGGISLWKIR
jgi:F-type H+-transporting ATPase subunit gamma